MVLNGVSIVQNRNNYKLIIPINNTNVGIAYIVMPPDNQFIDDTKTLEVITKEMAIRWGIQERRKRK